MMNVFDALAAQSGKLDEPDLRMLKALVDLLAEQPEGSALERLRAEFEAANLTRQMNSWIGPGQSLDISGDQLETVVKRAGSLFTSDWLAFARSAAGLSSTDEALRRIARLLPGFVRAFTPRGEIPSPPVVSSGLEAMRRQLS